MITTAMLAAELGMKQRAVQKRIASLGIKPQCVGRVFVLTPSQAQKIREAKDKPGPTAKNPSQGRKISKIRQ